jgi:DMSO/TMAO reductase YedYZ heme-binding membrane subunit
MTDTGTQAFWFLTRGTGAVSLLLLTSVVALGIVGSVGWANDRWPRFVTQGLHRSLSLLAVSFLGVHVATAIADGYAPIRWADAVIPFVSAYRPVWLGLGAVALDLLLALVITSLVRLRLGYRSWKTVHWFAYACWPVALVHGLGTGSDTTEGWMLLMVAGCVAVVVGAVWWRAYSVRPPRFVPRLAAVGATAAGVVGVAAWLVAGPLAPGWATESGTPTRTLAAPAPRGAGTSLPASASFTARASERTAAEGAVVLDIVGSLDTPSLPIEIELDGSQTATGLSVERGSVVVGTAPARYEGAIASLDDGSISARLTDPAGDVVEVDLSLHILNEAGATEGTVRITPAAGSPEEA